MSLSDDEVRQLYGLPPGTRVERSSGPLGQRLRLTPDGFRVHTVTDPSIERSAWDRSVIVPRLT